MGSSLNNSMQELGKLGVDVAVPLGPRGGNTERAYGPQYRRESLNLKAGPDGGVALHASATKEWRDTAAPGLQKEQPWHRIAAFMLLQGRTNVEIAMAAQVTPQQVSNLRAQRWFQELLGVLANETGQDIAGLMQAEALASIQKIVEIRDDPDTPARVQLTAATTLLEHAQGKPTQKIVTARAKSPGQSDLLAEMHELTEEISAIEKQIQHQK